MSFLNFLSSLAWPAVVVWLVWYLRDEVKGAAKRITALGYTGAQFADPILLMEKASEIINKGEMINKETSQLVSQVDSDAPVMPRRKRLNPR